MDDAQRLFILDSPAKRDRLVKLLAKLHVSEAKLADGKRVAQLVTEGVKIEKAEE